MNGTLTTYRLESRRLANSRHIWVYSPPGYRADGGPYPFALLFDGAMYAFQMTLPQLLDEAISAGVLPPVIVAMVDSISIEARRRELPCNVSFATFVAKSLMPWLQTRYPIVADSQSRLIGGASYGGLAAAYIALTYPDLFGRVLAQSGSFWWSPDAEPAWLTRHIQTLPNQPLTFALQTGDAETQPVAQTGLSLRDATLDFAAALRRKGHTVGYTEFSGGHDQRSWRTALLPALCALLPTPSATQPYSNT